MNALNMITLTEASLWNYVGEGGKHAVFSYAFREGAAHSEEHPEDSTFKGKLLRISKNVLRGNGSSDDIRNELEADLFYLTKVVAPYLGAEYVDVPEMVALPPSFVRKLHDAAMRSGNIPPARLSDWKRHDTKMGQPNNAETSAFYGTLVTDYRSNNSSKKSCPSCWTVEIKPKAGYVAFSPLVLPRYRHVKYHQSRFQSLQLLCQQGDWKKGWDDGQQTEKSISNYDPLDLFSGNKKRIQRAVQALFATPQNNLRVCPDDDPPNNLLQDVLVNIITQQKSQALLERILAWQRLDILDVDGACIVYKRLVELLLSSSSQQQKTNVEEAETMAQSLMDDFSEEDLKREDDADDEFVLPGLEASPFRSFNANRLETMSNNNRVGTSLSNFLRRMLHSAFRKNDANDDIDSQRGNTNRRHVASLYRFCSKIPTAPYVKDKDQAIADQARKRLLDIIQNELGIADCVFLLRNWLLSLMMCDISIFVTLEEVNDKETVSGDDNKNTVALVSSDATTSPKQLFRYSLHVIDCDPKPAKKLHGRAKKEEAFAKLG